MKYKKTEQYYYWNKRHNHELKKSQGELDKRVRFFQWKYNTDLSSNLEHFSWNSPKQFWDELKSVGPKKKNKIPKECYIDDGIITSETDFDRNVWKSEFARNYTSLLLYADDIAIISDCAEHMQEIQDTMSRWCTKWRLSINIKKSAVIHFRKKGHRGDFMFKLNKNILQYSEEYKYLGVIFHEKINFSKKQILFRKLVDEHWEGLSQKFVPTRK